MAFYSALANDGITMTPYLVDNMIVVNGNKEPASPDESKRICSPETVREIVRFLQDKDMPSLYGKAGRNGFIGFFSSGSRTYTIMALSFFDDQNIPAIRSSTGKKMAEAISGYIIERGI